MNKVVLVGRLTAKPELRYTNSNVAFTRFTLAVNLVNATFEFVYLNSGLAVNLPINATLFIFITSSY